MQASSVDANIAMTMSAKKIIDVKNPDLDQDASTKKYTDDADALAVKKTGSTSTGNQTIDKTTPALILDDDSTSDVGAVKFHSAGVWQAQLNKAANFGYLQSLSLDANIAHTMSLKRVIDVKDPTALQEAATKNYVDVAVSDEKFKDNIIALNLSDCLVKLNSIPAVSFRWKADAPTDIGKDEDKGTDILGFIAQDVGAVIPEAVKHIVKKAYKSDEVVLEYEALKRDAMLPILWAAVQALSAKVEALENK